MLLSGYVLTLDIITHDFSFSQKLLVKKFVQTCDWTIYCLLSFNSERY